jgi:hypothetical protein
MRIGLLLILITLIVVMVIYMGKGRRDNPVAQGTAALNQAKAATLVIDMNNVADAVTAYFNDNDQYPDNLDILVPKYLSSANFMLDSWGNPFRLEKDAQQNLSLVSAGPDQIFATADDIKRRL